MKRNQDKFKHGYSHGPKRCLGYSTWCLIKQRCYDKNYPKYPTYGGRGISMCDRWRNSFIDFIKDMGDKPVGMSIERIDVNGNYEPLNCKWATPIEQCNNKRNNRILELNGLRLTSSEWARRLGIPYQRIRRRLFDGMAIEKVLCPSKMINQYS